MKKSAKVILRDVALTLLAVFFLVGIGNLNLIRLQESEDKIRVAVLQPSIPQEIKWEPMKKEDIFKAHLELAQEAAEEKPRIIIWPEASVPAYLLEEKEYLNEIRSFAKEANSYLLVGGLYRSTNLPPMAGGGYGENKSRCFNSSFMFSPKGEILDRYDKLCLVPFGEYVPLRPILSNIKAVAVVSEDTSSGSKLTVFETDIGKLSAVICFESTNSLLVRRLASRGAEMLVIMTNDGWFKRTAAAEQHLSMAVLRAVENNFFVVQAANTGISAVIDSRGRILSRTALFERRYLSDEVVFKKSGSFYRRFGDIFSYSCLLISLVCLVSIIYSKNPKK